MFSLGSVELERAQRLLGTPAEGARADFHGDTPGDGAAFGSGSFAEMCAHAGFGRKDLAALRARAVAVPVLLLIFSLVIGKPVLLLLVPAFFFQQYLSLSRRVYKRAEAFEKDYTALLLSLASAVRTGLDPLIALSGSDKLFAPESEVAREVVKTRQGVEQGMVEEEALRKFASTIDHPDIGLFRTAFILARKEGASLGECLQRLARVTRQRQSFRRKVKSAVAMQKLSAFGIAGCTVAIGIIQWVGNPQAIITAFSHPVGFKLLIAGFTLVALGLIWMLRMARARI